MKKKKAQSIDSLKDGVVIASCVGGGPIERLKQKLDALGIPSSVFCSYTPEKWRSLVACSPKDRLRARACSMFLFPGQLLANALQNPPSVLVPTTNPFFLPFLAVLTKPLHRRPVVPLIYDLYPDAPEALGKITSDTLLSRLIQKANQWWFKNADGVVFIGDKMSVHARTRYGSPQKWRVIETGADTEELDPSQYKNQLNNTPLTRWCDGKLVISYVGNLGLVHDWETIKQAIPKFIEKISKEHSVGIVISASGPGNAFLRKAWATISPEHIRFEDPLPDSEWVNLLIRSSISLVTLRTEAKHTSIPSKVFSAMAAKNAIVSVAPLESDLAQLIKQHECGKTIKPGDVNGLVETLIDYIKNTDLLETHRKNAQAASVLHYDMKYLAQKWRDFLEEIVELQR